MVPGRSPRSDRWVADADANLLAAFGLSQWARAFGVGDPSGFSRLDAMQTQTDTAMLMIEVTGDYVLTVKGNQPALSAACKALPARRSRPQHHHQGTRAPGHPHDRGLQRTSRGRVPRRHSGRAVRWTVTEAGKKTVEVVYSSPP